MKRWLALLPLVLLASCSVQAKLVLQPSGAADVSAEFRLSVPAREAWKNLRELDTTLPADPFDAALLQKAIGARGKVSSTAAVTAVELSVADLRRFVPTWSVQGDVWEGTIDREVVRRWANLTAWSDSPALDSLLPSPGVSVTENEYRDLLVYLLGPGTAAAAAKILVENSTVQVTLITPRPLKSAPGSVSFADRTAVYRWPLARVLVLEAPIKIRLVF